MSIYCPICLSSTSLTDPFSTIPCGHIFHLTCISEWLKKANQCPECRARATSSKIVRLFLKLESAADVSVTESSAQYAEQWIQRCQTKSQECEEKQRQLEELRLQMDQVQEKNKTLEASNEVMRDDRKRATERIKELIEFKDKHQKSLLDMKKARREWEKAKEEAESLRRIKILSTGEFVDIKQMLHDEYCRSDGTAAEKSLAVTVEALRRQLESLQKANADLTEETRTWKDKRNAYENSVSRCRHRIKELEDELREKDERNQNLQTKIATLTALLQSNTDVPQTQLKRFVHESPAPADLAFLTPANLRDKKVLTPSNHQMELDEPSDEAFSSETATESSQDIPDEPLNMGKKTFLRQKDHAKKPRLGKSVFGGTMSTAPVIPELIAKEATISTPVEIISVETNPFVNPFKKVPIRNKKFAFARKVERADIPFFEIEDDY